MLESGQVFNQYGSAAMTQSVSGKSSENTDHRVFDQEELDIEFIILLAETGYMIHDKDYQPGNPWQARMRLRGEMNTFQ